MTRIATIFAIAALLAACSTSKTATSWTPCIPASIAFDRCLHADPPTAAPTAKPRRATK
jgi:hypothetical protein